MAESVPASKPTPTEESDMSDQQIAHYTLAELEARIANATDQLDSVTGRIQVAARRRADRFASQEDRAHYKTEGERLHGTRRRLQDELLLLNAAADRLRAIAAFTDEEIVVEIERITAEAQRFFEKSHRARIRAEGRIRTEGQQFFIQGDPSEAQREYQNDIVNLRAEETEAREAAIRLLTTLTPLQRERWNRTETGRAIQEAFPNVNIK